MTNGPHFGPRVVGDEQYKKEEKFFSSGAHHFGSRVTGEPEVAVAPEFDWYALDVDEALEHIKGLGPPDLVKIQGMEISHPNYVGGRGMILDAIEERLG